MVKLAGKQGSVVLNAMPPNAPNVLSDARAATSKYRQIATFDMAAEQVRKQIGSDPS